MNFKFEVTSGKQLLMQSLKNLALKISDNDKNSQYTENQDCHTTSCLNLKDIPQFVRKMKLK